MRWLEDVTGQRQQEIAMMHLNDREKAFTNAMEIKPTTVAISILNITMAMPTKTFDISKTYSGIYTRILFVLQ